MTDNHIDTLYVITGISRLTGEREACSIPIHKSTARLLLQRWKSKPAHKRDYLYLRVEAYTTVINFKHK